MRMLRTLLESLGLSEKGGAKTLTLPGQPKPPQFKAWRNTVRTRVIAHVPKRAEAALHWVLKVEQRGITFEALADSEGFDALDMELAAAITAVVVTELGRTINIVIDDRAKQGLLTKGRQLLYMVYEHFRATDEDGALYDLSDLIRIEWLGDDKIAQFEINWDLVISGCGDEPFDERTCRAPLLVQLRKSSQLQHDLAFYDRQVSEGEASKQLFHKALARRRHLSAQSPMTIPIFLVTAFRGLKSQIHRPSASSFFHTICVFVHHSPICSRVGLRR